MSSSECAEHKFLEDTHQLLFPKKSMIRDIDNYMPPRKLLTRLGGAKTAIHDVADMFTDSPRFSSSDETLLRKFLPHNNLATESDDDDPNPYSSEHFRMYEFKVRRCNRSRSHDWTDCPFAHPGEKARRRDPRKYHYSGTICSEYRRSGACRRGDSCEYAHGVFECWLHPARYRTEACKDGKNCKRKVCFFAHTPRQLRILPVNCSSSPDQISDKKNKFLKHSLGSNSCCMFCHRSANANSSPTSTLFGMSHFSPPLSPSSPPMSPIKTGTSANGLSPISRYSESIKGSEAYNNRGMVMTYRDALTELVSSLEVLNFSEASSSPEISATATNIKSPDLRWLDVSSFNCDDRFIPSPSTSFNCEDQQQMILSASSQISQNPTALSSASRKSPAGKIFNESRIVGNDNNGSSCATPDLGWVNDLLI
ncbi:zinc finger CCCH domain-containing protein 2 [Neltuma alba]|uniref:zinc finger CCCH domain-containing protein 2 n=1 Tax=Neltuma alba TaxID=207710 RepID=UPI0010A552BE|nr:zinc finger CCCH domain-containing protein 2 [Prosopis alba]